MPSKREARIARELERKLKHQEKSARLVERIQDELSATKIPRLGADPGSIFHMQMAWTCDSADREGSWSWGQQREWGNEVWNGELQPKLDEFAVLLWSEIDAFVTGTGHKAHHGMPVDNIDAEPQMRLTNLGIENDGDIFRFRLGNRRRLWGFRVVNVFEVLWYDPEHMIYRVDPD